MLPRKKPRHDLGEPAEDPQAHEDIWTEDIWTDAALYAADPLPFLGGQPAAQGSSGTKRGTLDL